MDLPARVQNVETARAELPTLAPTLLPALWRSDPLADDVAADLAADPSGNVWKRVAAAAAAGAARSSDPASVRALLAHATARPAWFEPRCVYDGGRALVRRGPIGGLLLGGALLLGYASPAGNKPLVLTGALERRTSRRIAETARFVEAVTRSGGMTPGAEGFAITLKVRVMHARVRGLCLAHPRWDSRAWGHPINQHDMLGTLVLFSGAMLEGFATCGVPARDDEARDYLALWSWVGHVMGVEDELLPMSRALAGQMRRLLELTEAPPDDDARRLTRAFLDAPGREAEDEPQRRRAERFMPFHEGFLRGALGEQRADALGLRRTRFRYVVPALRTTMSRSVPFGGRSVEALADAFGRRYWDEMLAVTTASGAPAYAPPAALVGTLAPRRRATSQRAPRTRKYA